MTDTTPTFDVGDQVRHIASGRGFTVIRTNVTYIGDAGLMGDNRMIRVRSNSSLQEMDMWADSFEWFV